MADDYRIFVEWVQQNLPTRDVPTSVLLIGAARWLMAIGLLVWSWGSLRTVSQFGADRTWLPARVVYKPSETQPAIDPGAAPLPQGSQRVPATVELRSPGLLAPMAAGVAAVLLIWMSFPHLTPEVVSKTDWETAVAAWRGE